MTDQKLGGNNGTGPEGPDIPPIGDPLTGYGPSIGAWLGMPVVSPKGYQSIASRYQSQSPSAHLPPNTHPSVVAGYAEFQKLHAKMLRSRDSTFLWLPLGPSPFTLLTGEHVTSIGTINIDPANPNGEPIVDYRALSNPLDIDMMVEHIRFCRRYIRSPDFAQYSPRFLSPQEDLEGEGLRQWVRDNYVASEYHPIGTASKKPKRLGGVVDEELFVYGTKKLRVVDASIMPMLPGANTQQTVYMIAEKVCIWA